MNYHIKKAELQDIDRLIKNKLETILDYALIASDKEIEEIKSYVNSCFPKYLEYYKNIYINNEYIGSFSLIPKEDGYLLDEIYIIEKYRNKKIGTNIINSIIKEHNVYLWVYKENKKAYNLYKRLGFKVIQETKNRYYMEYKK